MKHSNVISGSTFKRREMCPGSYNAEKGLPEGETSEAAIIGTALHEAMEKLLLGEIVLVGDIFSGVLLDQELYDNKYQPAVDSWVEFVKRYAVDEFEVEAPVRIPRVHDRAHGYTDVLGRTKNGEAFVLDWKFGEGEVDPEENHQLAFYALGALSTPETLDLVQTADVWHLAIVQPAYGTEEPLKVWTTTRAWLDHMLERAQQAVARQFQPDAPRIPGSHCRWCKARAMCPEFSASMNALTVQPPTPLEMAKLGELLDKVPMMEAWIKALNEHAYKLALAGTPPNGYKLVEKRAIRRWQSEGMAEKLAEELGFDPHERKVKSPAQIEKAVGKKAFREHFDGLVTQTSSGLTLVPERDKRPGIQMSAQGLPTAEKPF